MSGDIENKGDIKALVDTFYSTVRADDVIGPIFNHHIGANWDQHLPKMYQFWERIIFATGAYAGNPLAVHLDVDSTTRLTNEHFERWLEI